MPTLLTRTRVMSKRELDPEVAAIVEKFGLNKGSNTLNRSGFTRNRSDKKPLRSITVDQDKEVTPEDELKYKKSLEEGAKDYQAEKARMIKTIGKANYAASQNRFRKGDATQIVFIKEEPEKPRLQQDGNINFAASLEQMRRLNEQRKREEEEANYVINKTECKNMEYLTGYRDRATYKVVAKRAKEGWDSRYDTKKELGNTKKETINSSKFENEAILKRMNRDNPNSHLFIKTCIVNDVSSDTSVEQSMMNSKNINFMRKTVEEDLVLNEEKINEKIDAETHIVL